MSEKRESIENELYQWMIALRDVLVDDYHLSRDEAYQLLKTLCKEMVEWTR